MREEVEQLLATFRLARYFTRYVRAKTEWEAKLNNQRNYTKVKPIEAKPARTNSAIAKSIEADPTGVNPSIGKPADFAKLGAEKPGAVL